MKTKQIQIVTLGSKTSIPPWTIVRKRNMVKVTCTHKNLAMPMTWTLQVWPNDWLHLELYKTSAQVYRQSDETRKLVAYIRRLLHRVWNKWMYDLSPDLVIQRMLYTELDDKIKKTITPGRSFVIYIEKSRRLNTLRIDGWEICVKVTEPESTRVWSCNSVFRKPVQFPRFTA